MDKKQFYPTPEEVAHFVGKNSYRTFDELLTILGVDKDYLENIIAEKRLKIKNLEDEND